MLDEQHILELNNQGLLAEVLGFETQEVARKADGSTLSTVKNEDFLDFTGGIAVHSCGHNHPEIIAAIQSQASRIVHTSDIMRHAPQLELAAFLRKKIAATIPGEPYSFVFMNSGSESIDSAAKFALKLTGRKRFIAFEGAFHGRTLFATALSCSKSAHWQAYDPIISTLRQNIHHLPAARCGECLVSRRNRCCLDAFESYLEQYGNETAAVFFEPQQGEGGYFPFATHAAQRIQELAKQHGILLIADEIQSGLGRTGRWFGFEHLNVAPDVIVFGKAVGGGLPLAGIAAPTSKLEQWLPGEHGTTFGGNPLACAAGLAALHIIEKEGLVERAARLGEYVKSVLRPLIGTHGVVDVRGNGLMLAIEFRDSNNNPDYHRTDAIKQACRDRKLLLLTCGAKIGHPQVDNSAIRLIPPLNIADADLDGGVNILIEAIKRIP